MSTATPAVDGAVLMIDLVLSWAEGHPDEDHRLEWLAASGLTDEDVKTAFHQATSDHFWAAYDEVVGDAFRNLGYEEPDE